MSMAMADAGMGPGDIDYVNLHGTSTQLNDAVEALGRDMPQGLVDLSRNLPSADLRLVAPERFPDREADFKVLRAYSPYHNIRPGTPYPALIVTTAGGLAMLVGIVLLARRLELACRHPGREIRFDEAEIEKLLTPARATNERQATNAR